MESGPDLVQVCSRRLELRRPPYVERETTMSPIKSLCLATLFCVAGATAFAQTAAPAKGAAAAASPAVTAPAAAPDSAKKAAHPVKKVAAKKAPMKKAAKPHVAKKKLVESKPAA